MAYNEDIDLYKLLSTILEYTVDSTPTDTPTCACKADGGNCGDDTSTCAPKDDGTYDITSCTCPDGKMIFCPKCPNSCECKPSGSCGDDPDTCPDAPRPLETIDCYDSSGLVCNVCPKCPPPTPTQSETICSCLDCGLWPYKRDDSCWEDTCVCSYGKENSDCWYCPSTDTPTSTCDTSSCFCNTGTNCDFCLITEDCVNKQNQTCGSDPSCYIICGDCVPKTTDTPTPTPTDTTLCPCDCADFNSMPDCEDFKRRYAIGVWHCSPTTCSEEDGSCFPNSNCANLIEGPPTPTVPTPTPTSDCRSRGCYAPNGNCEGCAKNGADYCLNCVTGPCSTTGQSPISCKICIHVPRECKNGKYSTKEDCETALANDPEGPEGKFCDRCDIFHNCTDGTPNQEECYCFFSRPTNTPTPTTCYCREYGYENVGACGIRGACNRWVFTCPRDNTDLECDECCTPTPTVTCNCTDHYTSDACFSSQDNCDSYADTVEALTGQDCTCSQRQFPCGNTDISCYCAVCRAATPPPSPSPSPTQSCPPGCCRTEGAARALLAGKCLDDSCCSKSTYQTRQAPPCDCYAARLVGSADTNKPCGNVVGVNCYYRGNKCTSSTNPICYNGGSAIFPVERGRGPNDGDYTNCG